MKKLTKGFTLIELLVVIAIIGILSSVVLASLNTARDKGADAAAKANLNSARAQAELYYDDHSNSYAGVCSSTTTGAIGANVAAAGSATGEATDCDSSPTAWAAEVSLKQTTDFYCVDSRGIAVVQGAAKGDSATACN